MAAEKPDSAEAEYHEATGGLAALVKLREEFAGWSGQADEDCDDDTLGRVLAHIQSLEAAYRNRRVMLEEKLRGR
jgi:hypothetical protein